MILDVLPRPVPDRVWIWTGQNTSEIRELLVELGRTTGNVVDFVDNGDRSATLRSATRMYGTYEHVVDQGEWYSTTVTYMGVVPERRTVEQINEAYVPYPTYPPVIEPPSIDV